MRITYSTSHGLEVFDVLDRLIEVNTTRQKLVQLGHAIRSEASSGDHAASSASVKHFEDARHIIRRALETGIADGTVRADTDCELVALQAVAMMEGLENQWLADSRQVDLVRAYKAFTVEIREKLRPEQC